MTRIRYKLGHLGYFTDPMLAKDTVVFALIKPNGTAEIIEVETKKAITVFSSKSNAVLKKLVKRELIDIGVKFDSEVRPRLKGLDKGKSYEDEIMEDLLHDQ